MAQIKPFPDSEVIRQTQKDRLAVTKSRGGEASANPPSTNLPASVKLESDVPPLPVPVMGEVPFVNPVTTPLEALAGRTVNNAPANVSIQIDKTDRSIPATTAGIDVVERSINEAVAGGTPNAQNVIARDGYQVVTNDMPDDPDHV